MLITILNAQVSDTTGDATCTEARYQKTQQNVYSITLNFATKNYVVDICSSQRFVCLFNSHFCKKGVKNIDSDLATGIRTVIILFMIWGIIYFKRKEIIFHVTKQNWLFLVLSGIATGLSWIFYFKALQLGKVSQVAPVDKLSVALTILLSVIFLGEVLTWKTAAGAGLIIAGTLVLIL